MMSIPKLSLERCWHLPENLTNNWLRNSSAPQALIDKLCRECPFPIPSGLLALWAYSNGGESGHLDLPPGTFILDRVEEAIVSLTRDFECTEFPGLFFFSGNGGLERLALDYRASASPLVVMVDPIAGIESVEVIANSVEELFSAVCAYPEDHDEPSSSDGYSC
ncbi:SMI1/KNR4 family protein [Duganella sp. Root1480D1]|uniref:SMI1/KNR4 family protein n=1 Tax=Duganella sp. Root1480D1 TaxID=1736471 RepID=UPI0012E361BD|nr:SMI1/KNR4 family protein [Duganella sp. Root1480D1]